MPRPPRWNAADAESALLKAGFVRVRSKGSHRIYQRDTQRAVVPFHGNRVLHPKIVKQILDLIEEGPTN